ncbi:MAG: hypothetical protein ABIR96_00880, partial [Bdellovibrionota bacterium]
MRSGLAVALSHFSGMLPVVVAQGEAAFEIKVSSTQKIHIDIEDVEAGVFRIDGKRFVWDEDENFEANAKRIATLIDGDGLTAQILLALIPTAFAGSMTEEEPETSPVPTKSGIRTAKEPDSKTIQTSEEIKDKAKKDCSDQERQGKGACSVGFWIGIAVAVAAAALLIYFICKRHKGSSSKKSKKRLSSSSKSTSKPEKPKENHPWIDAPNFGSAESNLKTASSAGVVNENSKPSSHTPSTWT